MLEFWNDASLAAGDFLLGWMLQLPSDLALFALALITAGLMALVRPLTTSQDLLRRTDRDRRRLKELTAEARKAGDKAAILRCRATGNRLAFRKLGAEVKPLVAVLLPVAVLATWAMARLEFHPPVEGEVVEVVVYAPLSAAGEIIHLVPKTTMQATSGWVQTITIRANEPSLWNRLRGKITGSDPRTPEPDAVASWLLKGTARPRPYSLLFRLRDQTIFHELLIGQTCYSPPVLKDGAFTIQIKMREVRLFGFVPGLGEYLPGWLVGYLLIVLPLAFVVKRVLGIY